MDYVIKRASALTEEEQAALGITGIPQNWPIEKYPYNDVIPEGFELISEEDLAILISNNQAAYDAWLQAKRPIIEPQSDIIKTEVTNQINVITEATSEYSMKADAMTATCPENTVTDIWYKVELKPGDSSSYQFKYLWGGMAFGSNIQYGDWVEFDIADKDGWLVATGQMSQEMFDAIKPVSIKSYVVKQFVCPNQVVASRADSPGKIPIGLYLRCRYHAIAGGGDRTAFINFDIQNKD